MQWKKYAISNLKLQKLLYFIQAIFLCEENKACFDDEIQAWEFGPVVPRAYFEYKYFGGINIFPDYIDLEKYDENKISSKHKEDINDIMDELAKFTAGDLVRITHEQEPWIDANKLGENTEITKESLVRYFNGKEFR